MKILTDIIAYRPVVSRSSHVTMEIGRTEIATAEQRTLRLALCSDMFHAICMLQNFK